MENNFNSKKHMIYSSILFNFLIVSSVLGFLQGYKCLWLLITAFILPIYLYSMKSKKFCTIKEGIFYSTYTTFPLFIILAILYILSLLIDPLGLLFLFKLPIYACIIWASVSIGFILLNLCFVGLYKLVSKTSFYKNWTQAISILFLYLTHKSPFLWVLVGSIIAGIIGINSSLIKNNAISIVGTSQLVDKDSFYSRAIIYDKNKLLVVYRDLYEVFDIDKKERIKWGKIDGLKYKEDLFSLNKINEEEVFIANLLEYHYKNIDGSHLFSFGVLNLKDFSYKPLGEYTFDKSLPDKMYAFDNGKIFIVGDSTKAYIFDGKKIDSFQIEEWGKADSEDNMLIPYKDKYILVTSRAWQYEPHIDCVPLIQEFNPNEKSLKTIFKQKEDPNYRPLNTLLNGNRLIITSQDRNIEYKLKIETVDLEKMKKISENIIVVPDNEFSIRSAILQEKKLLVLGSITMYRSGYYVYDLETNTLNKKLFRTDFMPGNSDAIINLENGDIINYKNIYSRGKIYLFKNLTSKKQ